MSKSCDEFIQNMNCLWNLEDTLLSILNSEEQTSYEDLNEFFSYLHKIAIQDDFSLYEAFLHILAHLTIICSMTNKKKAQKKISIIYMILDELILNFSLKDVFHQSTFFPVLRNNKLLLLHLYEKKVIDLSSIENVIRSQSEPDFFLFFLPEIQTQDIAFYQKTMKKFLLDEEQVSRHYSTDEYNLDLFSEIRKEGHSNSPIAKIIREDDMDSFLQYVNKFDNINEKIQPSFLEINGDINNKNDNPSFIQYAMAFGSINIFKYLFIKKANIKPVSCLIGGNPEIIHILEEESPIKFDVNCIILSMICKHYDLAYYLLSNISLPSFNDLNILSDFGVKVYSAFFLEKISQSLLGKFPFETNNNDNDKQKNLDSEIFNMMKIYAFLLSYLHCYLLDSHILTQFTDRTKEKEIVISFFLSFF